MFRQSQTLVSPRSLTHMFVGNLYQYFNPAQESPGDVPVVSPGLKLGCSDPDRASLLSLQLSRVLRLLKYPAEDSENPPQVNMSLSRSQVCLKLNLGPNYCSVKSKNRDADHMASCWNVYVF